MSLVTTGRLAVRLKNTAFPVQQSVGDTTPGRSQVRGSPGTGLAAAGFPTASPMGGLGTSHPHVCKRDGHAHFTSSQAGWQDEGGLLASRTFLSAVDPW